MGYRSTGYGQRPDTIDKLKGFIGNNGGAIVGVIAAYLGFSSMGGGGGIAMALFAGVIATFGYEKFIKPYVQEFLAPSGPSYSQQRGHGRDRQPAIDPRAQERQFEKFKDSCKGDVLNTDLGLVCTADVAQAGDVGHGLTQNQQMQDKQNEFLKQQ